MECSLKFENVQQLVAVVDDLTDAKSDHMVRLRNALAKELDVIKLQQMFNVSPSEVEKHAFTRCYPENLFMTKKNEDGSPLKRCGEVP